MKLGAYSLMLAVAAANGAFLALLLVSRSGCHRGSRWLAVLTAGIALRLIPYILGFAGAYDAHPWLTFAPFDVTLTWGPLLWSYVVVLSTGAPPRRWPLHFIPATIQFAYQGVAFMLPPTEKWHWYSGPHLDVIEPVGMVFVLLSVSAYGVAAYRRYEVWQVWLDGNLSNRDESRLGWLRLVLAGFAVTGVLGVLMAAVHWTIMPLDYFARLPVIVALAILAYLMALLGYRFGAQAIPMTDSAVESVPVLDPAADFALLDAAATSSRPSGKDYSGEAAAWRSRVKAAGWHRDPNLTLARLAQLLQTSTRSVSRTLNQGRGESFNDFVNRLRVEEAVTILAHHQAPDVLRVAFDVGFASKASFNRAFKRHTGATPTGIRAQQCDDASQLPPI